MKSENLEKPSRKLPPDALPRQDWQKAVAKLAEQMSPEQKAQARQVLYEKLLGRKS